MKKLLVEFIGTFFLVLVIALSGNPLAIGIILAVMVYMGGHISGAHYNPSVSFAVRTLGKMSIGQMLKYWLVQLLGAFAAAVLARWVVGAGLVPMPGDGVGLGPALVIEAVFTFALVLTILQVAVSDQTAGNQYYGLAIGFTILAAAFAGGPISGGAFNPAVGVSPLLLEMIQGGDIGHVRIYIVGPLVGALVATWAYRVIDTK